MPTSHNPYSYKDWEETNIEPVDDVKVAIIFGVNKIKPLYVIVEAWHHKLYGKGRREYLKTFDEKERKIIGRWHTHLETWFMCTGIPVQGVRMNMTTYNLLIRAANLFATI